MPQEHVLVSDIITEHRERMLNLKKYYPFFKLSEVSFSWLRDGAYDCLDMGYILMAVLRFFIEENNFKERDVTYQEYVEFMSGCLKRDFGINPKENDMAVLVDYIFNKLKNDGKPFVFTYFDPVDKKKKVSRVKLLESRISDGTVWYSISPEGIEFYLDTKEIRDESKISVEQLLLEKMIRSKDFKGGTDVVKRINREVDRLYLRKNQVMNMLSTDVFAGLEEYEDFFRTGIRWFDDEQKLFVKNTELIEAALKRSESDKMAGNTDSYLRTASEIYHLDTELKVAMNNHSKLIVACTELAHMADDMVKKAKLNRLRPRFDFRNALDMMIKKDDITLLSSMVVPCLGLNLRKSLNLTQLDDMLTYKADKFEKAEVIEEDNPVAIVFEDEIEEERIKDNYNTLLRLLLTLLKREGSFDLRRFNDFLTEILGPSLFANCDYYSFLVNLCQKKHYRIMPDEAKETFLDGMVEKFVNAPEFEKFRGMEFDIDMESHNGETIRINEVFEVTNISFRAAMMT